MGTTYRTGDFAIQAQARRVLRCGAVLPLGARAFDVLMALIERRDRVVGKDELMLTVWPGVVVEENNLTVQVSLLRKVLEPGLIATVPGRGYRFAGELEGMALPATAPATAVPPKTAPPVRIDCGHLRSNLPALLPPLIGRADELRALDGLMASQRLVTRGILPASWAIPMTRSGELRLLNIALPMQPLRYAFQWRGDDRRPLIEAMLRTVRDCIDFEVPVRWLRQLTVPADEGRARRRRIRPVS